MQLQLFLTLLFLNLYARVQHDLHTTIAILKSFEFDYIISFTSEFYTFIDFHITN